ncbi:MAG: hypothetical protein IPG53_14730 [Ignavibacteriales bacterium]|nr:hypothetical protein [Ignavibacteriales bacterium]
MWLPLKERDKYNVVFLGRYRPAGAKNLGDQPNDLNAYYIRPYIDPAVAYRNLEWTGCLLQWLSTMNLEDG